MQKSAEISLSKLCTSQALSQALLLVNPPEARGPSGFSDGTSSQKHPCVGRDWPRVLHNHTTDLGKPCALSPLEVMGSPHLGRRQAEGFNHIDIKS